MQRWAGLLTCVLMTACGTSSGEAGATVQEDAAGADGGLDGQASDAQGGMDAGYAATALDAAPGPDATDAASSPDADAIDAASDVPPEDADAATLDGGSDAMEHDAAGTDAASEDADAAGTDAATPDVADDAPDAAPDVTQPSDCTSGTACNDGNACTADSCNPATGCVFAPTSGACSDGNACTSGDFCSSGGCQPGTPLNCDDADPCTTDSCGATSGACSHVAIAGCGAPTYSQVNTQVFAPLCVKCHGTTTFAYSAIVNVDSGDATYTKLIYPGFPDKSAIVMAIDPGLPLTYGGRMPKDNPAAMTAALIQLMRDWVSGGALQ
jgi:hypothetical protein